jgi:hypothetical protein
VSFAGAGDDSLDTRVSADVPFPFLFTEDARMGLRGQFLTRAADCPPRVLIGLPVETFDLGSHVLVSAAFDAKSW